LNNVARRRFIVCFTLSDQDQTRPSHATPRLFGGQEEGERRAGGGGGGGAACLAAKAVFWFGTRLFVLVVVWAHWLH
jgi:hypothetical protein